MNAFIEMEYEDFVATYKPILNHINKNSSFGGYMFKDDGDEIEFVKSQPHENIWLYGHEESGCLYIWNGWGFENRYGFFITEVPCPLNTTIQINLGLEKNHPTTHRSKDRGGLKIMSTTTFENKALILGQLWVEHKGEDEWTDFFEYNDLGLPLAFALAEGIISHTPTLEQYINETWILFLENFSIEDEGFTSLEDIFEED